VSELDRLIEVLPSRPRKEVQSVGGGGGVWGNRALAWEEGENWARDGWVGGVGAQR